MNANTYLRWRCAPHSHLPFMNKLWISTQIINYTLQSSSPSSSVAALAAAARGLQQPLNLVTANKARSNWKKLEKKINKNKYRIKSQLAGREYALAVCFCAAFITFYLFLCCAPQRNSNETWLDSWTIRLFNNVKYEPNEGRDPNLP